MNFDTILFQTAASKVVQFIGSIVVLILIIGSLTSQQQGYYYLFGTILMLQSIFEFGASSYLVQVVSRAHTKYLVIKYEKKEVGYNSEVISIVKGGILIYLLVALVAFLVTLLLTSILVANHGLIFKYIYEILFVAIAVVLGLLSNILFYYIEGFGDVKSIVKIRLIQQILYYNLLVILFLFKFQLLSLPLSYSLSFLFTSFIALKTEGGKLLVSILKDSQKINWQKWIDLFPFQKRIALSWLCGYFIFYTLNPIIFYFFGPIISGQFGMTQNLLSAIFSLGMTWFTSKAYIFSQLATKKKYVELEVLFRHCLKSSLILLVVCYSLFLIFIYCSAFICPSLGKILNFDSRILPFQLIFILTLGHLFNFMNGAYSQVVRTFLREPFVGLSIIVALCVNIGAIFISNYFSLSHVIYMYVLILFISFLGAYRIFIKERVFMKTLYKID